VLIQGDLAAIGRHLDIYWKQKQQIAGPSANPPLIRALSTRLNKFAHGLSLGGAGGGGFLLLICKEKASQIQSAVEDEVNDFLKDEYTRLKKEKSGEDLEGDNDESDELTNDSNSKACVYTVSVDRNGLVVQLEPSSPDGLVSL